MRGLLGNSISARQARTAYAFIGLIVVYFIVMDYYPVAYMFYLSFFKASGLSAPQFIGFGNLAEFFRDPVAMAAVANTFRYAAYWVPSVLVTGFVLALLLNRSIRLRRLLRAAYFVPVVTPMVAVAMIWKWLYQPSYGLLNYLLSLVGVPSQMFLHSQSQVLPSIALMGVWKSAGFFMVIFLAGMQGIPETLYEAADVDGANEWQKLARITIPLLKNTMVFALLMAIIEAFQVFTSVFVLTTREAQEMPGGPVHASMVLVLYLVYEAFRNFRFGYGATVSLVLFLILLVVVLIQFRVYRYQSDF